MFFPRKSKFEIGPIRQDALADCVAIHGKAFHRGWDENEFSDLLSDASVLSFAAFSPNTGHVVGFILSRRALDEAEILTLAVDARARGAGIGYALLQKQIEGLSMQGVTNVFLEVDERNKAALALYARAGFLNVGKRVGYYPSQGSLPASALVLRRRSGKGVG